MINPLVLATLFLFATSLQSAPKKSKKDKTQRKNSAPPAGKLDTERARPVDGKNEDAFRFLVGAGIQSLYLPSLGIEALMARGNLQIGGELGLFQLSQAEFRGGTSFVGITARWQLNQNKPFFVGASFGLRNISLTTSADLSYTDVNSGSTSTTTIAWSRKVSQTVLYPKAGWIWSNKTSSIVAAGGLIIPFASKGSITGNPPSAEGISDDDYQATANSKLNDVTKTTNSMMPSLEFKYIRFVN